MESFISFFFVKLNTNEFFTSEFAKNECDIAQNQCIWKVEFRFGSFGFGSVNLTEISVSVVSVFTCFGRPLDLMNGGAYT